MAKRVPDDDGSNLPPLEFTTTDFTDDPGTMAYHLIELARRLGAHPSVHGARLYLTVERDMERAEAEDMTVPQMLRDMRAICVKRGLLGDSPETDHQPKAPAKRKPDEAVPADDGAATQAAGPPAPAEDRTAYIPATDVIAGDDYVTDFKDLHRILKAHPGIRTHKPSEQRLDVHAGDWNRYKRGRDAARDAALDSPAGEVDSLIEAARARKAKERETHFPSTSRSDP